jgi:hypothetical protein
LVNDAKVTNLLRRVFTLDLRSLALCRILAGLVVIGDLLSRACCFRIHYTDAGILPRQALFDLNILRFPSLYAASGSESFLAAVFVLHGLAALALCLGYRTRFSGALVWYLTISLQQRLYLANNGGDTVLASVLFWGMFLPWGEAMSVDAASRRARGDLPTATAICSAGSVVLCLQVLLMYWVSVLAKMEPTWLKGEVLYYAFQCDLYARPVARMLLPYLGLMKALAYSTMLWETVGPLLLLSPRPRLRALSCALFSFMHLSFGIFLRLGIFGFSPVLFPAALLPAGVWTLGPFAAFSARWDRWCDALAAGRELRPGRPVRLSRPVSFGLGALFVYTSLSSLQEDPRIGPLLPPQIFWIGQMTGLYQRWGVFVDMPRILDGWFVVEARLSDGHEVDLFQGNDPVSWAKPYTPFQHYRSFRWPTPMVVIVGDPRLHRWFVRALALDWQRRHPARRVTWARFNLMREQTQPGFRDSTVKREILWEGAPLP